MKLYFRFLDEAREVVLQGLFKYCLFLQTACSWYIKEVTF